MRFLLVEPYCAGSHAGWVAGYRRHSAHAVTALTLPGRFWKWRMHGASVTLARQVAALGWRPDVVLASDMLDVATFLGLAREPLAGVPVAVYFHENQLAYPPLPVVRRWSPSRRRRAERRDAHYGFMNLTSALAADRVLWNSAFNRDSFLGALPTFLGAFPDYREEGAADRVASKSQVLPVGLDLATLDRARPKERLPGPPRVVWNHRWEHDKDPATFFAALDVLRSEGVAFEVVLLGQAFGREPPEMDAARQRLGERVRHWGHVPDREAYAAWLWQSDVVVSTACQEFFGVAVAEAVHCGCQPVVPRRLAYPELVAAAQEDAVLYQDFEGLVVRLREALTHPNHSLVSALQVRMAALDWSLVASRYDETLLCLAESSGPSHPGRSRP